MKWIKQNEIENAGRNGSKCGILNGTSHTEWCKVYRIKFGKRNEEINAKKGMNERKRMKLGIWI